MKQLKNLGLRINMDYPRVDAAQVERARKIPVAVVGDVANRLQAFTGGFAQYGRTKKFSGPAFTVRVRPGDNLFLHKALDLAQSGDVVVVDAGGVLNTAIVGAMMTNYAKTRGIEALVIDGAIRDIEELAALAVPDDDVATVVLEHTRAHFARERAFRLPIDILCADGDICASERVAHCSEVRKGHADRHVAHRSASHSGHLSRETHSLRLGGIHLPVAGNKRFAHGSGSVLFKAHGVGHRKGHDIDGRERAEASTHALLLSEALGMAFAAVA